MAGGIAKTFGSIFLILGILGLLAGAGGLVYGYMENESGSQGLGGSGLVQDEQRKDDAEKIMLASGAAAALGVLFLLLGIVFLIVGGSRSRNAFIRALGSKGTTEASTGTAVSAAAPPSPPTDPRRKRLVVGAVIAVALLLVIVVGAAATFGGRNGGLLGSDPEALRSFTTTLRPVFNSDEAADSPHRFILSGNADTAGMTSQQTDGSLEHAWSLPLAGGPLEFTRGAKVTYRWTIVANTPGVLSFKMAVQTDAGAIWSAPVEKTATPGAATVFEGDVEVDDESAASFAILTNVQVMTGAPAMLVDTELQQSSFEVVTLGRGALSP